MHSQKNGYDSYIFFSPCKIWFALALFLLLIPISCLDYKEVRISDFENVNMPPFIDKTHVRPAPAELLRPVKLGLNCKKEFTIPPIKDPNRKDSLYYLWFFKKIGDLHGKLLQPRTGIIHAENRDNAVISLTLDRQAIENTAGEILDEDFFKHSYLIEFYIADRPYLIPDNRYTETNTLEDYMHWSITFTNENC